MDKHYSYELRRQLRLVKPWYFLVITLIAGGICIVALRSNNLQMVYLRNQVYDADKNNGDVVKALQNLQVYVTTHMNTDLSGGPNGSYPPIQLVYSYDRAVETAGTAASSANYQLYTDAEDYCQKIDSVDFSGHNRVPCIEQYVESHGASAPNIPVSLYEFDFISPSWSPDLAGWSLLVTIISVTLSAGFWLGHYWHRHRRTG